MLRQYIRLLVEKVRAHKQPDKVHNEPQLKGLKFSWNRFKSFENPRTALSYADTFLTRLGVGSSRIAYTLTSTKVLKVAHNNKGTAQNEAELSVYTDPNTKDLVTKIYDYAKDYSWLVSEPAREIKSEQEFKKLTKLSWNEFSENIEKAVQANETPRDAFLLKVFNLIKKNDLGLGDVTGKLDHWGISASGKLVLLDYGFTRSIARNMYQEKERVNDPDAPTNKM